MRQYLKYIAIIIACGVLFYVIAALKSCNLKQSSMSQSTIVNPTDSNFAPVEHTTYQPPSLPALSKTTSGIKLPKGLSEKDVKKVVELKLRTSVPVSTNDSMTQSSFVNDSLTTLDIIETRNGDIFVKKDSLIQSVKVIHFEPPVFAFNLRFGAGVSAGYSDRKINFSPVAVMSLVDWNVDKIKFQAPIVTADLDGVGLGAQFQLYNNLYFGAIREWRWNGESAINADLNFMF